MRDVSWNDRVYDFGGGERYSFSNGSYSARSEDDECEVCLQIRATSFGDVDFDGREEAIVLVSWNLGGASTIINGYIFSLEQGAVILRGEIEGGDRANGGLASVTVADGQVLVSRFGGDSACCPSEVVIERWRWSSDKLVRQAGETIEPRDEKPWYLQR